MWRGGRYALVENGSALARRGLLSRDREDARVAVEAHHRDALIHLPNEERERAGPATDVQHPQARLEAGVLDQPPSHTRSRRVQRISGSYQRVSHEYPSAAIWRRGVGEVIRRRRWDRRVHRAGK